MLWKMTTFGFVEFELPTNSPSYEIKKVKSFISKCLSNYERNGKIVHF